MRPRTAIFAAWPPPRWPIAHGSGGGVQADVSRALSLYEQAIKLGHKASAHNLGLFWEGAWGCRRQQRYPGPHEGHTELSARWR